MANGPLDARHDIPSQSTRKAHGMTVGGGSVTGPPHDWPDLAEGMKVYPLATVDVEHQGDISVARLRGEIDTSNVSEIGEALGAAAVGDGSRGMVVDLSGVAYLNSATVKLLFDLAEQMHKRHQQMRLVMSEAAPMRKLILLLKFDLVVPLDKTIDDALAHIRTPGAAGGAAGGT